MTRRQTIFIAIERNLRQTEHTEVSRRGITLAPCGMSRALLPMASCSKAGVSGHDRGYITIQYACVTCERREYVFNPRPLARGRFLSTRIVLRGSPCQSISCHVESYTELCAVLFPSHTSSLPLRQSSPELSAGKPFDALSSGFVGSLDRSSAPCCNDHSIGSDVLQHPLAGGNASRLGSVITA
jgi:hypothetical protein